MTETDHIYTSTCIVTATVMTVPDTDVHIHSNGNSDEGLLSLYIARYYVIALYRALKCYRSISRAIMLSLYIARYLYSAMSRA